MKFKIEYIIVSLATLCMVFFSVCIIKANNESTYAVSSIATSELSNKKIGWGIKREKNHVQPQLGEKNKELIEKYNGIAMGNSQSKKVYLTFDNGYEARLYFKNFRCTKRK